MEIANTYRFIASGKPNLKTADVLVSISTVEEQVAYTGGMTIMTTQKRLT